MVYSVSEIWNHTDVERKRYGEEWKREDWQYGHGLYYIWKRQQDARYDTGAW